MGVKNNRLRVVSDDSEKAPEAAFGLPISTSRISGLRAKTSPTQYSEGPKMSERPRQPDDHKFEVKARIVATRVQLSSVLSLDKAKASLRDRGLEDDLDEKSILDTASFEEVVKLRELRRNSLHNVLFKTFRYCWWESGNSVDRLWGHLNSGLGIIPRWQVNADLKAVLGKELETLRPSGIADGNRKVERENKEALKQQVYAKLVMEGFLCANGDYRIYTDEDLNDIIAPRLEEE
jgi:hypothetical protein